jgi:TldD protein
LFDAWLERAVSGGASYADLRILRVDQTKLELKDGELKEAVEGSEAGFGLRVLRDGAWGFASSNELSEAAGKAAVDRALALALATSARSGEPAALAPVDVEEGEVIWRPAKDPRSIPIEDKLELLRDVEAAARTAEHLATVTTGYAEGHRTVELLTTEGTRLLSGLSRIIASANLVGKKEGRISSFRIRVGGVGGFERLEGPTPVERTEEGAASLERLLDAGRPPAGRLTAIIDPDLAGVLVHEAFGHACEADLVLAGESILEGRIGESLGSELVEIFDDPSFKGGFGSFPFDDEGVRAKPNILMEGGVLKAYLHSRETAAKLGHEANGSARAQDHGSRPLVRMSNTFLGGGDQTFEELTEDIHDGIYVKGTRGGQVDVAKGTFQFGAQEAFLIEGGELTRPLRDVALMGSILDTLRNVDALGDDFRHGSPGFCGKGQMVPVGDGGPHVRVLDAVVGGG